MSTKKSSSLLKKSCNVVSPQVLADGTIRLKADLMQDVNSANDLKTIYELRNQETVVYVIPVEIAALMDQLLADAEAY